MSPAGTHGLTRRHLLASGATGAAALVTGAWLGAPARAAGADLGGDRSRVLAAIAETFAGSNTIPFEAATAASVGTLLQARYASAEADA